MGKAKQWAIGYLRVSTDEQRKGLGLEIQEAAIRAHCRTIGVRLVAVLSDEGISGSNGLDTRAGLAEALARIQAGDAQVLVVYRLDRLARDLLLQETVIGQLRKSGALVLSATEGDVESDDPTRVLVRQVLGAMAQYEAAVIRGRMAAGKAAKRAAGGYTGGQPAYGRRADQRQLVERADEAAVVARVLELRSAGRSYREICTALEVEGFTPRRASSWQPMVVRRIAMRAGAVAS